MSTTTMPTESANNNISNGLKDNLKVVAWFQLIYHIWKNGAEVTVRVRVLSFIYDAGPQSPLGKGGGGGGVGWLISELYISGQ